MRGDELSKDNDISAWMYPSTRPLFPQQQTFDERAEMSAMCHKQTHAPQQTATLFDHFIGAGRAKTAAWQTRK
jgi:hypothetical protein